jgi:hypothetical protein
MKHPNQIDTTRRAGPQQLRVHFEFTGPIHVPIRVARTRNKFPRGTQAWQSMACNIDQMNLVQCVTMLLGTTQLVGMAYRPRTHPNKQETPGL